MLRVKTQWNNSTIYLIYTDVTFHALFVYVTNFTITIINWVFSFIFLKIFYRTIHIGTSAPSYNKD